jgi:enoyl-CoA hydratase/carnithine racemase
MQHEKRYKTTYDPKSAPQKLEHLIYEKKGNVAYVTINRPERLNALHTYAHQELNTVWKDIQRDPNMYVAIITGNGRAFCAGRDVKFLSEFQQKGELAPHEDPNNPSYRWGGGGQPRVANLTKPVIAAINGLAVGVGMNIIMQCQLRVMAEDAWLGDQHTNVGRFGAPQELYMNLPPATASYLSLCNGRLTAQAALSQGVVNVVCPKDKVVSEAEKLAEMVCAGSPLATQAIVRYFTLLQTHNNTLTEFAMHLDKEISDTEDCAEGALAFKEKRKPKWKLR